MLRIQLRNLFSFLLVLAALTFTVGAAQAQIYYGTMDDIRVISDGSGDSELLVEDRPDGLVVDTVDGFIYWSETVYDDAVKRARQDGSDVQVLYGGTGSIIAPKGLALDLESGHLYWADLMNNGAVMRTNVDGSGTETLIAGEEDGVTDGILDVALDLDNGKMYWTSLGEIMRADLDGANAEVFADLADHKQPGAIAVNTIDGYVYWIDGSSESIMRASINDGDAEVLVSADEPDGLALDLPAGKIYWMNNFLFSGGDGSISRANLDGSDVEVVLDTGIPSGAIFIESGAFGTAVDAPYGIPETLTLAQNHPNPFNPQTVIRYELTRRSAVTLRVFDILGRPVRTLVDGRHQSGGAYEVAFDGRGLPSGAYFYRLETERASETRTMILAK